MKNNPERFYDLEPREKRAEVGFLMCFLSVLFIIFCFIWIFFPDLVPFMPSVYWLAATLTFIFSFIVWVPLFITIMNHIYYPK